LEATRRVRHRGVQGSMRETQVRRILSMYLPKRIELKTGQIESASGEQSRQQDCILLDGLHTVPFLIYGDEGTFPIETVFGTVEIKSNTRRDELSKAIRNVASVKKIVDPQSDWIPFGGIICLAGTTSTDTIAKTFFKICQEYKARERCDALVVVGQCALFWGDGRDNSLHISGPTSSNELIIVNSSEHSLLVFLLAMLDHLSRHAPPALSLFPYVNSADFKLEYSRVNASP
jgi:hypothetical protein